MFPNLSTRLPSSFDVAAPDLDPAATFLLASLSQYQPRGGFIPGAVVANFGLRGAPVAGMRIDIEAQTANARKVAGFPLRSGDDHSDQTARGLAQVISQTLGISVLAVRTDHRGSMPAGQFGIGSIGTPQNEVSVTQYDLWVSPNDADRVRSFLASQVNTENLRDRIMDALGVLGGAAAGVATIILERLRGEGSLAY